MMKDPCINDDGTKCKYEHFRCRHTCPFGVRYQSYKADERKRAKEAERRENEFTAYKIDRIMDTKKKAGVE
ncbi:MAG: hypothetical protein PHE79_12055 [Eubacteriales bacterium]|nr:hypothetical protein [Eubacteriales bacterium]